MHSKKAVPMILYKRENRPGVLLKTALAVLLLPGFAAGFTGCSENRQADQKESAAFVKAEEFAAAGE